MSDMLTRRQSSLDALLRWSPQFERGYDWNAFYGDNKMPPVLCHGTRSVYIDNIRKQGLVQNTTIKKVYSSICQAAMGSGDTSLLWFDEHTTMYDAAKQYLAEGSSTFLTAAPGIAWNYAHIGGQTTGYFLSGFARPMLSRLGRYATDALKEQIDAMEENSTKGEPVLVLVQTPLVKLKTAPHHTNAIFFDSSLYKRHLDNAKKRSNAKNFPDCSNGELICTELRYLLPDNRFQVPLTDDEESTTEDIPASDIVDVIG